jgi:hypothetical protein
VPTASPSPHPSSHPWRGSPPSWPRALVTARWRSESQSPLVDPSSHNRIMGSKGWLGK